MDDKILSCYYEGRGQFGDVGVNIVREVVRFELWVFQLGFLFQGLQFVFLDKVVWFLEIYIKGILLKRMQFLSRELKYGGVVVVFGFQFSIFVLLGNSIFFQSDLRGILGEYVCVFK